MGCVLCCRHDDNSSQRRTSKKFTFTRLSEDKYLATFSEKAYAKELKKCKRKNKHMTFDEKIHIDSQGNENLEQFENSKDDFEQHRQSNSYSRKTYKGVIVKEFDDWELIKDSSSNVRIKSVSVYFNHYISAIEIVYIQSDFREVKKVHCASEGYLLNKRLDCGVLNLDENEYISYIKYTFTIKNSYIRNIEISTTNGKVMLIEGQVELSFLKSEDDKQNIFNSIITGIGQETESQFKTENNDENKEKEQLQLSQIPKKNRMSRSVETSRYTYVKRIRPSSVNETNHTKIDINQEWTQEMDLQKFSQRLVGFKTKFSDYLLALEFYTETCTYLS